MPRDPEPPEPVLSELQARLKGVESALLDAIAVMVREPALVSLVGRRLMRAVTMIAKARKHLGG